VRFIPFQDVLKNHPNYPQWLQHNGFVYRSKGDAGGARSGQIQVDSWSKERKKEWMAVLDLATRNSCISNIIDEE